MLEVHARGHANTSITLYDMEGRIVFEKRQLNSRTVIDVSNFSKGIYVLEYIADEQAIRHRVVLE
jgi:hypothetical protein